MPKRNKGHQQRGVWPTFESKFLKQVVESFQRRSKSIKNKVLTYSCEKIIETNDGNREEKLELRFAFYGPPGFSVSCDIWEDRWLWVDVRQSSKNGWIFEWQHEGRVGATSTKQLAESLINTISVRPEEEMNDTIAAYLDKVWKDVALTGPLHEA